MPHPARPGPGLLCLQLGWKICLLVLLLCQLGAALASARLDAGMVELRQATLISAQGERLVNLPHALERADLPGQGGTVRYRLSLPLDTLPTEPLGVYVSKLSLSGRLWVNGQLAAACEPGPLALTRCHHRPHLFIPAPVLWHAGGNLLEFEIHATPHQTNGLSAILVGPADALNRGPLLKRDWWQLSLLRGLSWMGLSLGLLMLAVGRVLRQDSVYRWFGWTSIANALSNLNVLVSLPLVPLEFFSWLVFVSRLLASVLMLITLMMFFDGKLPRLRRSLVVYAVVAPLLIGLSQNNRWVVLALYLPLFIAGQALMLLTLRWTRQQFTPRNAMVSGLFVLLSVAGVLDMLRLAGLGAFEGVYWLTYAYSVATVLIGALLANLLAQSLRTARKLSIRLDHKVAQRTAELETANRKLAELSRTDGLTDIANRRHFNESLATEWQRAQRQSQSLTVMLIDIDLFKVYNDRLGHQAGDHCLCQVAQALHRQAHRAGDLVARYGGEEFAIIAHADGRQAEPLAERLRRAVEGLGLSHPGSPAGLVTISLGAASGIPPPEQGPEAWLRLADNALYQAKAEGRNRSVLVQAP